MLLILDLSLISPDYYLYMSNYLVFPIIRFGKPYIHTLIMAISDLVHCRGTWAQKQAAEENFMKTSFHVSHLSRNCVFFNKLGRCILLDVDQCFKEMKHIWFSANCNEPLDFFFDFILVAIASPSL